MEKFYFNQSIGCHVKDCIYHNGKNDKCNLASITVDKINQDSFCSDYKKNELE